jgi:hypothetical protein
LVELEHRIRFEHKLVKFFIQGLIATLDSLMMIELNLTRERYMVVKTLKNIFNNIGELFIIIIVLLYQFMDFNPTLVSGINSLPISFNGNIY